MKFGSCPETGSFVMISAIVGPYRLHLTLVVALNSTLFLQMLQMPKSAAETSQACLRMLVP